MESIRVGDDEYVAASELAKERDVHRASVYLAIENGHLPSVNIAGRIWVRKAEADKWDKSKPGRPKKSAE